ncbi:hypothetical protein Lrub_1570 [Legionella rubrilucens]|uniref:VWFA domain-containing protein n=1 Tax=Legionella rubrilucens TaxID=458 RepID=A0A0W0XPZ9_9GAMM|nr:VWA domain-containing protein [Legionella rubrilucens]KTD46648.1 hypothetical protein Lrub_1570 [Legionella rubrilucens]
MFQLAQPLILLLLPLPILIWFVVPRAVLALPAALQVPFYDAMYSIVQQEKRLLASQVRSGLFLAIWILLVGAAAGPRWVGNPLPLEREGRNIMMVLDISGSMELMDMILDGRPVNRLTVVKRSAEQFISERAGDKIGLILFGTRAYLQTPLTYDLHSVLMRIEDATIGLAGKTTSIGDALGLAVKRLQNVPPQGRVIILLTDGANTSGMLLPLKAAELAAADHIKVYTIGLGSEGNVQSLNNVFLGMGTGSDLDEDTLKKIAEVTGGHYFRATDPQSLQSIYEKINQLETISQDEVSIRPEQDYYPWLLAIALALFLYWFAEQAGMFRFIRRSSPLKETHHAG